MKTCMLREIDAQVARVNPQGECSSSPEYVFVIRPRSPNHNEGEAARREDLNHTTLDKDKVPVVHELRAWVVSILVTICGAGCTSNNYRIHHFHNYNTPVGARACKVLVVLCRFLGLDNADVEKHLLESGERLLFKLNLHGWHSDRPNLYFHCRIKACDEGDLHDRKSMELRESLAIFKDEEKALTRIMSDDNEDQQRRSSVLLVSR
ncbi:unnamed protein product [Peronospora belbahrii]|uniref:ZP domain-containing protein n=1 Tax=Peronospora belbahrii TaxID=622444 RepID=A0ABN8CNG0_9STRA|nr:unnamed protein product [Peronospora belbahrii]